VKNLRRNSEEVSEEVSVIRRPKPGGDGGFPCGKTAFSVKKWNKAAGNGRNWAKCCENFLKYVQISLDYLWTWY
jgi:hypothetical protein